MPQNLRYFGDSVHTWKKIYICPVFSDRTVVLLNLKLKTVVIFRFLNAKRQNEQPFPWRGGGVKTGKEQHLGILKGAKVFPFAPYLLGG